MLTAGEIILRVAQKLQIPSTTIYITKTVPRFVQDAYKAIWDLQVWPELVADDFEFLLPANTSTFILPKQYGSILRAYNQETGQEIKVVDRSSFSDRAYNVRVTYTKDMLLNSATPLSPSPVATQLTTAQRVYVVSEGADTVKVFIRGLDGDGERVSEVITLNGTTPVQSAKTYSAIEAWSKTARPTLGFISLTDNDGNTLATLGAWETTATYQRYQMDGSSPQDVTLVLTCKKAFIPFENDFDYFFTELDVPLVHKACAFGWIEHRKLDMAQAEEALFQQAIQKLQSRELNQSDITLFCPAGLA